VGSDKANIDMAQGHLQARIELLKNSPNLIRTVWRNRHVLALKHQKEAFDDALKQSRAKAQAACGPP